jgi:hypothetical protein
MKIDPTGAKETLFMTMNNIGGNSRRFPRVSAFKERTELQQSLNMSAVLVSRAAWPNERVLLWIGVMGKQMTRKEVQQTLAALGWIFREFLDEKIEKHMNSNAG